MHPRPWNSALCQVSYTLPTCNPVYYPHDLLFPVQPNLRIVLICTQDSLTYTTPTVSLL